MPKLKSKVVRVRNPETGEWNDLPGVISLESLRAAQRAAASAAAAQAAAEYNAQLPVVEAMEAAQRSAAGVEAVVQILTAASIGIYPEHTITGSTLTLEDGAEDVPVKSLEVRIPFGQSGTGDATPSNVRPITATSSVSVTRSGADADDRPQTYTVAIESTPGVVYAGTIDMVSGVLTLTHKKLTLDGTESVWAGVANRNIFGLYSPNDAVARNARGIESTGICSHYSVQTDVANSSVLNDSSLCYNNSTLSSRDYIFLRDTRYSSVEDMKAYLAAQYAADTPVELVYRLEEPITYEMTGVQITTLSGKNTIVSDAGDMTLTYCVDPASWLLDVLGSVPYVTPQMYGAVGDGEHDDTEAFQSALNSGYDMLVPTARGEIYRITQTLTLKKSGQRVFGDSVWRGGGLSAGGYINLDFTDSTMTTEEMRSTALFSTANIQMAHFCGLKFVSTSPGSSNVGVLIDATTTLADKDIRVDYCGAFYFFKCFDVRGRGFEMQNCSIASCNIVGVFNWNEANESQSHNMPKYGQRAITIKSNRFHSIKDGLFAVESGHAYGLTLQGNTVDYGCPFILTAQDEAWNWQITGNVFNALWQKSDYIPLLFASGAQHCVISGNILASEPDFWTTKSGGTWVVDESTHIVNNFLVSGDAFENSVISGNVFRSSADSSLVFGEISGTTISGNVFDGAGNDGENQAVGAIVLDGISESAAIVGNTFLPGNNTNAVLFLPESGTKLNNSTVYGNAHGSSDGGLGAVIAASTNLKTDEV